MRLSDRLQGLCAQSWAKTGLGKKPYNARKYGSSFSAKQALSHALLVAGVAVILARNTKMH